MNPIMGLLATPLVAAAPRSPVQATASRSIVRGPLGWWGAMWLHAAARTSARLLRGGGVGFGSWILFAGAAGGGAIAGKRRRSCVSCLEACKSFRAPSRLSREAWSWSCSLLSLALSFAICFYKS